MHQIFTQYTKLLLLLTLGCLFGAVSAKAQYTLTTIETGRFYSAVACDNDDNIYVVRYNGTQYEVAKYTDGTGTPTVIYNNLTFGPNALPWGIAVNDNGVVFVTNPNPVNQWEIIQLTPEAGGTYTPTVVQTGGRFSALFETSDNELLTIEYVSAQDTYRIRSFPEGSEDELGTWLTLPITLHPGATTSFPWGVINDAAGNFYALDLHENNAGQIIRMNAAVGYTTHDIVATGGYYTALTIDNNGNFYTIEHNGSNYRVVKRADITQPAGEVLVDNLSVDGLAFPWGLAVNSKGEVFIGDGSSATGGRFIKLSPPSSGISVASVTRAGTNPTNAGTVNFTVTFSGAASNVTASAFSTSTSGGTISGTSVASVASVNATTFTVTVNTGTGDGQLRLDVTGNGITETVTNVPYTTGESYTIDKTPPISTLSINSGAAVTNDPDVTLNIGADGVAPGYTMRFSNDNTTWSAYAPLAATNPWTLTAGDGLKTVYAQVRDAAGNVTSAQDMITLDLTEPVVTSVSVPANGYYNEGDVLTFTVQYNENVTMNSGGGMPYLELVLGASTVQAGYVTPTSTSAHTFTYTVQAGDMDMNGIEPGSNIILNGSTIRDAAGNNVQPALQNVSPTNSIFVNTAMPGVTLTTTAPPLVNQPFTVTIIFSEAVTGFTPGDITATNATISNLQTTNNITYTASVTPVADGAVTVQIPANAAQNIGDNGNTVSNVLSVTYDVTTPVISSVNVPANDTYASGEILTFTVNYSENVAVNGGTPSLPLTIGATPVQALYTAGSGTTALTFTYTVQDGELDADGVDAGTALTLNGATLRDAAGNNASPALAGVQPTNGVLVDATPPKVNAVNVPANGYYNEGDVLAFTVQMSENTMVNTTGGTPYLELIIGTATVHAAYTSGSNTSALLFSYTVQPGEQDLDGIALGSMILNGGTIRDAVDNNAVLTLNGVPATDNIFVYSVSPGVTLSSAAISPVNEAFTTSIIFSEAVTGFTLVDITATNATISNLQTTDNISYTVLVTPTANGAVTLQVPAGAAQNIGNNNNTASNTLSIQYDGSAPAVTSVAVPTDDIYHVGDVLTFTVNYSENVIVTGTPYINITIGTTTQQTTYISGSNTNALTFRYTVQNGDLDMDGIVLGSSLELNSGTVRDTAANNALPALNNIGNTDNVLVNTIIPTVVLSGTPSPNAPFTLTVTFSESVTGFALTDFTVTNATTGSLQTTDNIIYTVLATPAADGAVSISIPANVAQNAGTNGNQASNVITYTYDASGPAVTAVDVPANGYYGTGETLDFTVHFSENVTVNTTGGSPAIPLTIGTASVAAAYTGGSGTNTLTFRYTVQNGDLDMDGISIGGNLALNGGTMQDGSGNNAAPALNNAGNTSGVFVNTHRPTVTLTTAATGRVNTTVTVTLVFNEAVTGLAAADISITNGAASNLQTTDNITYTADITPAADGAVSVSLPADMAENIAGNGNDASNTVSFTYDATAPVINAGQSFTVNQYSPAGTEAGQVTAAADTDPLQNWAIATDGSGGALEITGTGMLRVKDVNLLGPLGGTTITLNITVSDGLNTSAATPVTIQVTFVNKAPALDAIANVSHCPDTETHSVQLTGASATEPGQTYTITATASQDVFDLLTVNASNVLSYRLKAGTAAGSATITVTIKDDGGTTNGGTDTLLRTFTVTVTSPPAVSITSDKGTNVSKGEIVKLTASGGTTYQWANADGIISGQQSAVLEIRPQANTTYEVTATNAAGCTGTGSISIAVVNDFKVDATNILTPNGDGRNDRWVVRNLDSYPDNEVKIFDRSGRLVYQQRNYSNTWDGTVNGNPLAEGTYYYILTISGGAATAKGYITIVRDNR